MRNAAFLFILFLAIPASAQPPVIDSMLIDESKGILSVYGKFGTVSGKVFCDSLQLPVINWSDTLIQALIPDTGKGSAGPVIVFTGAEQSNVRIISLWSGLYYLSNNYPRHFDAVNQLFFRIRTDLHSFLIHRTKQLIPIDVMRTSKLECDYRDLTPGSTIQDFKTLPLFSVGGNADSSFHCSASIDLTSRILKISVNQIQGTEPECAVDFKDDLPLDSVYQLVNFFHESSGGPGSSTRQLKADSTLFPPPFKAIALQSNPSIIAPANGLKNLGTDNVRLDWDSLNLMESYHIQVSKDSIVNIAQISQSQQSVKYIVDTISASLSFTLPRLEKSTKYFWRVCGVNSEGESRWSDVWSFTTGEQADVKEQQQKQKAKLSCYPNPASKEMTIRYTIADGSPAKILLYDMGGKLCKSQDLFAGSSETRLDVSELAGGMYVVGVVSGASQQSQLVEILR